ncbi:MAG: PatB family C-S lyase [Candidatus Lokiarchaeota archaeon]|nr:PatB family C-S lyase [Candidatus Harpocratesius repetitus]
MNFTRTQFENTLDRTHSFSIKWDPDFMIERFGTSDLLPFNHAEMDFECPLPIQKAVQSRAEHGIYGYTLVPQEYYNAVISWYKTRHQLSINTEEILYSTGVIFSLRNVIQFFTQPGDEIMLFTPIYRPLAEAVTDQQRKLITVPLRIDKNYYSMDYDAIEKIVASNRIKLCIICNPHNPVGRVWRRDELIRLGDICLANNILIVSDEIHCDLTAKNHSYTSILNASYEISQNAIMISSYTKTFNTSGLKTANIFIKNPSLRKSFFNFYKKKFVYAPNVFGIIGLIAAYTQCAQWVDLLTQYLDENYEFACNFINDHEIPITVMPREGTPLLWLDFRDFPYPSEDVFKMLLTKAHIISYDGRDFTANGEGFQRLSLGYPRKILKEGLSRILTVYKNIEK